MSVIELVPAFLGAWAERGSVAGVGARGGFTVDFSWRDGKATSVTVRIVGSTTTELRAGGLRKQISLDLGKSVRVRLP
ncbi:glycoside hydrolase family 95-like protein [Streptomyces sp. NPDC127036]|uniref:glycoside hydrolase family 95-like protein n=1 Tax=Streptomyces sp. NPDC127036 TaxID=3347112 RepID=UPI0036573E7F